MSVPVKQILAAGGLVWRSSDRGVEVALVHRPRRRDWTLPKGKLDPGELILGAACREVWEETGMRTALQNHLSRIRYPMTTPEGTVEKVVDYWAMRVVSPGYFAPHEEIDDLRWVPVERAPDILDYPRDIALVADFAAQPRITGVVIAHHAGEDSRRNATALLDSLLLFDPERIASFVPRHRPSAFDVLASRAGLSVEHVPSGTRGRSTAELVRDYATAHTAVVVSAEREAVDELIGELAADDGYGLPPATGQARLWVLSFAGRTLVSADPILANGAPPDSRRAIAG